MYRKGFLAFTHKEIQEQNFLEYLLKDSVLIDTFSDEHFVYYYLIDINFDLVKENEIIPRYALIMYKYKNELRFMFDRFDEEV